VGGRFAERTASTLNSPPMPVGEIQRCTPVLDSRPLWRLAAISPRGRARRRPDGRGTHLDSSDRRGETRGACLARQESELHVGREVGAAGSAERIDPGVSADRLQRVARAGARDRSR